jgi:circadian clock protein KaiC
MIQTERVPTGVVGLDPLLEGGFPKGRSILLTGEPGTGKTVFSLQFLHEGIKRGEKGVFVTADESPMDVIEQAASLGWDFEPYLQDQQVAILSATNQLSSLSGADREIDVHKVVGDLAAFVNQFGAQRLVLDPASPFVLRRDHAANTQDQTRSLIHELRASLPTTNLLTSYAAPNIGERATHGVEEYLVAGAIVLELIWRDGGFARSLIVEKMRYTNIKPRQLEFDIIKGEGVVLSACGKTTKHG